MNLLKAIRTLEKACLSSDSPRTTNESLAATTEKEQREYLQWLRRQAPGTSFGIPDFDRLTKTYYAGNDSAGKARYCTVPA
jgi:hypothetical protein